MPQVTRVDGVAWPAGWEPTPPSPPTILLYASVAWQKGWQIHPVTKQPLSGG